MKIIAMTQRADYLEERNEIRDALDQRWWSFLNHCGIIPLIIPNNLVLARELISTVPIAGILLTGGSTSPERDAVEGHLIQNACQYKLPLFGVCHGMQAIQEFFGISLKKIINHISHEQEILINGQPQMVNSYHNYGTTETNNEITVWARAHDGVIKAIRHISLPIAGIMWHPERILPYAQRDINLVKNFYNENIL